MLTNHTLSDHSGRQYRLLTPQDTRPHTALQAERFFSETQALRFLRQLTVPHGYWRRIHQRTAHGFSPISNENQLLELLSQMLYSGRIQIYQLEKANSPATSRMTFRDDKKTLFAIKPVSHLLTQQEAELRHFSDEHEARTFIEESGIDEKQLDELINEKKLPRGKNATHTVAAALASGELIVTVDRYSHAPPTTSKSNSDDKTVVAEKPAGLGSESTQTTAATATAATQAEKEAPPCITEWVSVSCSHDRIAGITDKTEVVPVLAVVATEKNKAGLEKITAEIHGTDLCDSHKSASFHISSKHKLTSREEKKIIFQANCGEWDVHNAFDRLWLPTVSPKTYRVTPKQTCKTKDLKVSEINVDVYPKMKWLWEVDIDFGKLEFVPGQAKIEYSNYSIDGNVTLTYDEKPYDAKEKYDEYIGKPLEGFKNICDKIAKVLEVINNPKAALMRIGTNTKNPPPPEGEDNRDGNETKLEVTWPNLSIEYESELIENQEPSIVDHKFSIGLKADPLLDVNIQVNVLDALISAAPYAVKKLLEFAKKRISEELDKNDKVGFSGELDIIFTVETKVDIDEGKKIEATHNRYDKSFEVKPITGNFSLPAELKGVAKAEGKWFSITFEVNYELSGKAGWEGKYEFGKDDIGIYFSDTVEFTGIDVIATKYEEVSAKVKSKISNRYKNAYGAQHKSENGEASIKLENGEVEGEATLKTEESQPWSWLKPEQDQQKKQPVKHYLVKN